MAVVSFNPPCAVISGSGYNVPERVITNDFFSSYLQTTDEWIVDRTGIKERRWSEGDGTASDLALPACRSAIDAAEISPEEIDGVIVATCTPDYIFPSTACILQGKLGIAPGFAFDINAVCSGFVYALSLASSLMASGVYRHILVVGVDLFSKLVDKQDRSTCILFGDGAGAVILSRRDLLRDSVNRGVMSYDLGADGRLGELLITRGVGACGLSSTTNWLGFSPHLQMDGREIFKLAVRNGVECGEVLCRAAGVAASSLDFLIFHQANQRILSAVGKMLQLRQGQVLSNVERFGNTSAASIPILIAESMHNGILCNGHLVLLCAFGGGITWGGVLLRF